MSIPITDLHCDLLCYLQADPKRTPQDPVVKCSLPQLAKGPVETQIMAVFCETGPDCVRKAMEQIRLFHVLQPAFGALKTCIAIEDACNLFGQEEDLKNGFERFATIPKPAYISLTWNVENRFGGGAHTKTGLKPDGEVLLDFLNGTQVAVDLSHTSDLLAYDILNYCDRKGCDIPIIASHSNFRAICNAPRNLPDEIAKEIFNREGVIGINFVKSFVGEEFEKSLISQLEHGLRLGGEDHLCFGADFFFEGDVPEPFRKPSSFFDGYNDASCYGRVLDLWRKAGIEERVVRKVANENAGAFLNVPVPVPSAAVPVPDPQDTLPRGSVER